MGSAYCEIPTLFNTNVLHYRYCLLLNYSNTGSTHWLQHTRDKLSLYHTHPLYSLVILSPTLALQLNNTPLPISCSPRAIPAACCSLATDLLAFVRCDTHHLGWTSGCSDGDRYDRWSGHSWGQYTPWTWRYVPSIDLESAFSAELVQHDRKAE